MKSIQNRKLDLKIEILALHKLGKTHNEISRELGVPKSTVTFQLAKYLETGSVGRRHGSGKNSLGEEEISFLGDLADCRLKTLFKQKIKILTLLLRS